MESNATQSHIIDIRTLPIGNYQLHIFLEETSGLRRIDKKELINFIV